MVLFTDSITHYFEKQDIRLTAKPIKRRLNVNVRKMDFVEQLTEYKAILFQKEMTALFSKNNNIYKTGDINTSPLNNDSDCLESESAESESESESEVI